MTMEKLQNDVTEAKDIMIAAKNEYEQEFDNLEHLFSEYVSPRRTHVFAEEDFDIVFEALKEAAKKYVDGECAFGNAVRARDGKEAKYTNEVK